MDSSGWYRNYFYTREHTIKKDTIEDLKEKIIKINEAIECLQTCDLSEPVNTLIVNGLMETKANLKEIMHKMINEL